MGGSEAAGAGRGGSRVYRILTWTPKGEFGTYGPELAKLLSGVKPLED